MSHLYPLTASFGHGDFFHTRHLNTLMSALTSTLDKSSGGDFVSGTITFLGNASMTFTQDSRLHFGSGSKWGIGAGALVQAPGTSGSMGTEFSGSFTFVTSGSLTSAGFVLSSSIGDTITPLEIAWSGSAVPKFEFNTTRSVRKLCKSTPVVARTFSSVDGSLRYGFSFGSALSIDPVLRQVCPVDSVDLRPTLTWPIDAPVGSTITNYTIAVAMATNAERPAANEAPFGSIKVVDEDNISQHLYTGSPSLLTEAIYRQTTFLSSSANVPVEAGKRYYVHLTGPLLPQLTASIASYTYVPSTADPSYFD